MSLDKQSDPGDAEVDEEILAVFHAFPYAEPNVDNNHFDKRSPIGKWVGRGMAQQPFYFWGGTKQRDRVCSKKGVDVPEPGVLALALAALIALCWTRSTLALAYVWFTGYSASGGMD